MKNSVALSHRSKDEIKIGTRVQSFSTHHDGEVIMVDSQYDVIWIRWEPAGAVIPHVISNLDDVFAIDN